MQRVEQPLAAYLGQESTLSRKRGDQANGEIAARILTRGEGG